MVSTTATISRSIKRMDGPLCLLSAFLSTYLPPYTTYGLKGRWPLGPPRQAGLQALADPARSRGVLSLRGASVGGINAVMSAGGRCLLGGHQRCYVRGTRSRRGGLCIGTVMKVLGALGVRLTVAPKAARRYACPAETRRGTPAPDLTVPVEESALWLNRTPPPILPCKM